LACIEVNAGGEEMTTFVASMGRERLYKASPMTPEIVQVPEMSFVMVDGHGDPNTAQEYADAIQALYSCSYTLKFALKKERGLEYRVGPLEGLWWADDPVAIRAGRKDDWDWTAMIGQPDDLTDERFETARQELQGKKDLPALALARFERFEEGTCAQILHVGPYSAESPTIEWLHEFIREEGYRFDGRYQKHHEIYLSDPRRSPPERWKTIIRQPISTA
jgi:hypothetical protein